MVNAGQICDTTENAERLHDDKGRERMTAWLSWAGLLVYNMEDLGKKALLPDVFSYRDGRGQERLLAPLQDIF